MAPHVRAHKIRVVDGLAWATLLSADEQAKAARFRFQADTDRFVAGRGAVRELVGRALDADPRGLRFGEGRFGKPFVVDGGSLRFNVSHSGAWVLIALVDDVEVGIDVELSRPDFDVMEVGATVFSERELASLTKLSASAAREAFFRLWTRKEAALKAWGTGFSLDPRRVHAGTDSAPVRIVEAPDRAFFPATVEDMIVDQSHAGAWAVAPLNDGMPPPSRDLAGC